MDILSREVNILQILLNCCWRYEWNLLHWYGTSDTFYKKHGALKASSLSLLLVRYLAAISHPRMAKCIHSRWGVSLERLLFQSTLLVFSSLQDIYTTSYWYMSVLEVIPTNLSLCGKTVDLVYQFWRTSSNLMMLLFL